MTGIILLGMILFLIRQSSSVRTTPPDPIRTLSEAEWHRVLAGGHRMGSDSASVTLVEFSDFLCTHCKHFLDVLDLYRQDHPGQLQIIIHTFPLPQHPLSRKLAASAECVAKMGNFGEYYSLLFKNQDHISQQPLDSLAKVAGVRDMDAFHGCLREDATINEVRHDWELGREIGLIQTPTIIINRDMYSGPLTYRELSQAVDYALEK